MTISDSLRTLVPRHNIRSHRIFLRQTYHNDLFTFTIISVIATNTGRPACRMSSGTIHIRSRSLIYTDAKVLESIRAEEIES